MYWKIYFVVYIALTILGGLVIISNSPNLADWVSGIFSFMLAIPAYSIAFNKNPLSKQNWKILLWINVVFWGINAIYELAPSGTIKQLLSFLQSNAQPNVGVGGYLFAYVMILPALYAAYKLSKLNR